jgi:hypothetical protein
MSPARRPLAAVALLSLLAAQGACASRKGARAQNGRPVIVLQVRNDSFSEHVLYLFVGTERQRLGNVSANNKTTILLPSNRVMPGQQMRIVADPIGSNQLSTTGPLVVSAGSTIEFRIAVQPSQSTVFVR